jgi:hypothetical protein
LFLLLVLEEDDESSAVIVFIVVVALTTEEKKMNDDEDDHTPKGEQLLLQIDIKSTITVVQTRSIPIAENGRQVNFDDIIVDFVKLLTIFFTFTFPP